MLVAIDFTVGSTEKASWDGNYCPLEFQVDYIIREATSVDNLALLYEGWTPWV